MGEMVKQEGPRPGFAMNQAFNRDRFRLLMRAIDLRRAAAYAQGETPFPYRLPPGYEAIGWPAPDEPVNLRPALGYNKYI